MYIGLKIWALLTPIYHGKSFTDLARQTTILRNIVGIINSFNLFYILDFIYEYSCIVSIFQLYNNSIRRGIFMPGDNGRMITTLCGFEIYIITNSYFKSK